MGNTALALLLCATVASYARYIDHPAHESLEKMPAADLELYERQISGSVVGSQPLPPPIAPELNVYRLVHDAAHPFVAPGFTDQRGPCPGSNAMANHGFLPHNGIASPAQLINASMEAFGMGWNLAVFTTYAQHIVAGNHLTNLMSIGRFDVRAGIANPFKTGGYGQHNAFEGDASLTRKDKYLGDHLNPDPGMFNELTSIMDQHGAGIYNATVAALTRQHVTNFSIGHNPTFKYDAPRYVTSYGEAGFPLGMMSNLSDPTYAQGPDKNIMRTFMVDHKFPDRFHRRNGSWDFDRVADLFITMLGIAFVPAGVNDGKNPNTFVADPGFATRRPICETYEAFVKFVFKQYPSPTGKLKQAIIGNLDNFYVPIANVDPTCVKLVPPYA